MKEVSTSSSVDYLTDISTETLIRLSTDTNRWVTGMGGVYFKSETSIFTYLSINRSIDLSTDRIKWTEGNMSRTPESRTHYLTNISMETWRRLQTNKN